jgi:hypothetical protein
MLWEYHSHSANKCHYLFKRNEYIILHNAMKYYSHSADKGNKPLNQVIKPD